jgi:hypothetical protein
MNFDRRNLLKGLLALPGAAALGGWMSSCNNGKKGPEPPSNQTKNSILSKRSDNTTTTIDFNIVLHGTYALQFDTQNQQALILIPSVFKDDGTPAHEYKAGLFRLEIPIDEGPKTILPFGLPQGTPLPDVVTKNPTSSDPTQFVILRKGDLKQRTTNTPLRNTFQLPYPNSVQVAAAHKFKNPGHTFFKNDGLIPKTPTQVPLCVVLQYTIGTAPVISSSIKVAPPHVNYHIYAESPKLGAGMQHVKIAFSQLTQLYEDVGGLALTDDVLNDVDNPGILIDAQPKTPDDLTDKETLSLEDRDSRSPTFGSRVGTCAGLILVSGPDA